MLDYINNLKSKPEHIRRRMAFMFSFMFTFIIFSGWVVSSSLINTPKQVAKKVNVDAPVSTLTATAIGAWNDIRSIFLGSNKVEFTNDSIEVLPGNR